MSVPVLKAKPRAPWADARPPYVPLGTPVTGTADTGAKAARSGITLKYVHDTRQGVHEHALVLAPRRRIECVPGRDPHFASFHYIQRTDEIHDQTGKWSVSKTDICAAVGADLMDINLAARFQRNRTSLPGKMGISGLWPA